MPREPIPTTPISPSEYHDDCFLTKKEAQFWLRVSEERIGQWIKEGRLKSYRVGGLHGRYMIRAKWVRDFIRDLESGIS